MARRNILLLIAFLALFPLSAWSDSSDVARYDLLKKVSFDASACYTRMDRHRRCNQDITINAGYRNVIATARFTRNGSTFVNSWMLGYRYEYAGRYSLTGSIGFSDAAFRKYTAPYSEEIIRSDYIKQAGFCGQVEASYRVHVRNRSMPMGITVSYAYHHNNLRPFHLYGVGMKLFLLPHVEGEFKKVSEGLRERKQPISAELPRNLIRTKLLFGLYTNTFIEYERKVGQKFAWSIALGAKYNVNRLLLGMFLGADGYMKGVEINAGFYRRYLKQKGWWTHGLKAIYRHREGHNIFDHVTDHYMNRISDDIIGAYKVSFTWATRTAVNFELFGSLGIRWSYEQSFYRNYYPTYQHWLAQTPFTTKYWTGGMYIKAGLNIGCGW
jgi:hypothetical protein